MNTADLNSASISLRKGQIHRVPGGLGRRIESLRGSLWLTIDNDRRDILVDPAHGFSLDRPGDARISALDDASFVLLDPVAPARG